MSKSATCAVSAKMNRASGVSLCARMTNLVFGAPNMRRASGIVSTKGDIVGFFKRLLEKLGAKVKPVPVFEIDRKGTYKDEELPKIWLSERVCNTAHDDGRRAFVAAYPSGRDDFGWKALELADCYLGEGLSKKAELTYGERIDCFRAAEILYLHSARAGNSNALDGLNRIYSEDLCQGRYWETKLEQNARHARKKGAHDRITSARMLLDGFSGLR